MANFIYIIGEQQTSILLEDKQLFDFTADKMQQVATEELYLVLSNIFGKGEFFPGPQDAVTSIIHELVRRWDESGELPRENRCSILTSFKLITGEIKTVNLASFATDGYPLSLENEERFYTFLLEKLPQVQDKLANEAYAPDSKLVSIIHDSAAHHRK